jgi:predicted transcriptional regulator
MDTTHIQEDAKESTFKLIVIPSRNQDKEEPQAKPTRQEIDSAMLKAEDGVMRIHAIMKECNLRWDEKDKFTVTVLAKKG